MCERGPRKLKLGIASTHSCVHLVPPTSIVNCPSRKVIRRCIPAVGDVLSISTSEFGTRSDSRTTKSPAGAVTITFSITACDVFPTKYLRALTGRSSLGKLAVVRAEPHGLSRVLRHKKSESRCEERDNWGVSFGIAAIRSRLGGRSGATTDHDQRTRPRGAVGGQIRPGARKGRDTYGRSLRFGIALGSMMRSGGGTPPPRTRDIVSIRCAKSAIPARGHFPRHQFLNRRPSQGRRQPLEQQISATVRRVSDTHHAV